MTMAPDDGIQSRIGSALARMEGLKPWARGVPVGSAGAPPSERHANWVASATEERTTEEPFAFERMDLPRLGLPQRHGTRPMTAKSLPHLQLEQEGSLTCIHRLLSRVSRLPGLDLRLSRNAPSGSMSLIQDRQRLGYSREHLFGGREFARFHPVPFASIFIALPIAMRQEAICKRWAEPHPWAGRHSISPLAVVMYAPRNKPEELVALTIVLHAHQSLYAEYLGKQGAIEPVS